MKIMRIVFSMLIVLLGSVQAVELRPGMIEVGPYGGYQFLDDFSSTRPKDNFIYGLRAGVFMTENASFEVSYQMNFTESEVSNRDAGFNSLRFNLLHNFLSKSRVNPFLTAGLGWLRTDIDGAFDSNDLGVNFGGGIRVLLSDSFALRLDGRYIYAEVVDNREHNYEGSFGLSFLLGGHPAIDTDGDGIKDYKDECPNTPVGATVNDKGCPNDSDGDGVFDGIDKCPGTMEGFIVDAKGCTQDTDKDSVPDGPDQCPNTPEGAKVDSKGCPFDADGDGVEDARDKCPGTPAGVPVNEVGCPKDSDQDGVPDHLDYCAETALGTKVDEKGCPLQGKSRGVLKGVTFELGNANLTQNSKVILDAVAEELAQFPKVRVEVQGHTDSTGSDTANLKISKERAISVMNYLISKGIDQERLVSKGFGKDQPIATNKTAAGRAKNRRVELNWLD